MLGVFTPDYYVHSLQDIDPLNLKKLGIRLLFVDFDNTLVDSKSETPTKASIDFIQKCHDSGIIPVILSNNFAGRSMNFAKNHGCLSYPFSLKPLKKGYKRALQENHVKEEECAAIGDQLLTDIWGGSRMHITTILVDPISKKDNFFGFCNRIPERLIYRSLKRKGILKKGNYYGNL